MLERFQTQDPVRVPQARRVRVAGLQPHRQGYLSLLGQFALQGIQFPGECDPPPRQLVLPCSRKTIVGSFPIIHPADFGLFDGRFR